MNHLLDVLTYSTLEPNLDIATAGQSEYFKVVAPLTVLGTMNVTVQSQGLSLLAPKVTVYAAGLLGNTVVASASGAGQYGTTLNVSVPNVLVGSTYYIQVQGADNTALGTGDYSLGVSFSGAAPTQASPIIAYADGDTPSSGGGMAQYGGQGFGLSNGPPTITGISPDTGSSNSDGITNANRITISGLAPNGETITVYNDGTAIGTTVADANGNWTLYDSGKSHAYGSFFLTATAIDSAGHVSAPSLSYSVTNNT